MSIKHALYLIFIITLFFAGLLGIIESIKTQFFGGISLWLTMSAYGVVLFLRLWMKNE